MSVWFTMDRRDPKLSEATERVAHDVWVRRHVAFDGPSVITDPLWADRVQSILNELEVKYTREVFIFH